MSVLFGRTRRGWPGGTAADAVPPRPARQVGAVAVTPESALRHSAVWACLRLRANLVSTLPVDVYRRVGGVRVEVPPPPVLVDPAGDQVGIHEWLYASQFDLDRAGNAIGLITARDGHGLPARIELQPLSEVTIQIRGGDIHRYRIGARDHRPEEVWHERQYTAAGLHVGLSPVAHAAWSIGEYLSIQEFALNWFGNGGIPQAHLRNTRKPTVTEAEAGIVKTRFRAATQGGDMFVSGADWEYNMMQAQTAGNDWIEAKNYGVADIARFFDCPGDLIDAAVTTGNVTYANVTERNLQFLIMHLGPAVTRRERALTALTPKPRCVKLNTDALLRMDPATRAEVIKTRLDARTLTPTEARALDDLPPLTEGQIAEFDRLYGPPRTDNEGTTAR